jgi:hypothetical protein
MIEKWLCKINYFLFSKAGIIFTVNLPGFKFYDQLIVQPRETKIIVLVAVILFVIIIIRLML